MIKTLLLAITLFSGTAFASENNIKNYVDRLMNDSIAVLNDKAINHDAKTTKVRKMLSDNMDTNWMGRFTLGRLIKTISPTQASDFLSTYNDYVIQNYAQAVSLYKGEKVEIQSVEKMDEQFSIVKTQLNKSDGNIIMVNYLVRSETPGQYKVCDIITEGISLVNSHKAEYGSIIASEGIDSLITNLKQKTQ